MRNASASAVSKFRSRATDRSRRRRSIPTAPCRCSTIWPSPICSRSSSERSWPRRSRARSTAIWRYRSPNRSPALALPSARSAWTSSAFSASLLTIVALYICQLLFETPSLDFGGINARAIAMGIACPLAWYALLCALTTWLNRSWIGVLAAALPVAGVVGVLTLLPTQNVIALFIHDVAWVISRLNPLSYVSMAVPSDDGTAAYRPDNFTFSVWARNHVLCRLWCDCRLAVAARGGLIVEISERILRSRSGLGACASCSQSKRMKNSPSKRCVPRIACGSCPRTNTSDKGRLEDEAGANRGRANLKPSAPIAYRKMFGISGSPPILNANWPTRVVNVPPDCSDVGVVDARSRCRAAPRRSSTERRRSHTPTAS